MSYRLDKIRYKDSLSTIVEIINVLQTPATLSTSPRIYNSRNYKCLIDYRASPTTNAESTIVEIISVLQTTSSSCTAKKSTIVEIISVLQTFLERVRRGIIYNSRNYKCLIDQICRYIFFSIYNSRNYKCLIDYVLRTRRFEIYNSRNYKCLIDSI